ncbi:hypothetical protein [Rhizobium sullae]|uniref:hypothetical protein n=1 Tax=Rhizobium sullae TaxID=50338 RepID=UPI00117BAB16|nr:hypothetical protein [Rhizobium sullae]
MSHYPKSVTSRPYNRSFYLDFSWIYLDTVGASNGVIVMLLNDAIFPAVQAASSRILDRILVCESAELSFLYFHHKTRFVLIICTPGAPARCEIIEDFEEKTGATADNYFRDFAGAVLEVRSSELGLYQTSAISPAEGLANGAVGIARRSARRSDALIVERLTAASFLIGQLLKTFTEIASNVPQYDALPGLVLHRALDALTILFDLRVSSLRSFDGIEGHRERLLILIIALSTMAASAKESEAVSVEIAAGAADTSVTFIQKSAALLSPFMSGRDAAILRLAVNGLGARLSLQRDSQTNTTRVQLVIRQ